MKILVVVPYFEEPHRWMISGQKTAHWLSRHHQVTVVTTGSHDQLERRGHNLKIYRLKDYFLKDPINYSIVPHLGRKLTRIIKREKPEAFLINKHMFYTSLAIWPLKRLGKPVVVQTDTFPGINWFPKSRLVKAVMWVYARLLGNQILRAADKVVLLHEGLVDEAKKLGLNYEVIHNGIDLEAFDRVPPPADLKKRPGEVWVGYVGRLESVKGWLGLATIAQELVKRNRQLHFLFIGPTTNQEAVVTTYQNRQIRFLGLRHDVAGIDKLLDIFVMPSLSEGLSNALMEAMAAQNCCLATKVGGNQQLIRHEKNGLLFEAGNAAELKQALRRTLADQSLRRRLGQAARQTILEQYQLSHAVERLANLLERVSQKT